MLIIIPITWYVQTLAQSYPPEVDEAMREPRKYHRSGPETTAILDRRWQMATYKQNSEHLVTIHVSAHSSETEWTGAGNFTDSTETLEARRVVREDQSRTEACWWDWNTVKDTSWLTVPGMLGDREDSWVARTLLNRILGWQQEDRDKCVCFWGDGRSEKWVGR